MPAKAGSSEQSKNTTNELLERIAVALESLASTHQKEVEIALRFAGISQEEDSDED